MKKVTSILGIMLLTVFLFASCNSMQSDAKQIADLTCKAQGLMEKAMSGDEDAMTEAEALGEKMQTLTKELEAKYSDEELEKLAKMALEIGDCK